MDRNGDDPRQRYELERSRRIPRAVDNGDLSPEDAERIEDFLDAIDPESYRKTAPEIGTKAASTLRAYAKNLRLVATAADRPLVELDAEGINIVMETMRRELSVNTVSQRQAALRVFYKFHDDLGIDPESITIARPSGSQVDPRDLFDREEVDAIRKNLDNLRDRAAFDLMLYTGQRIRAIQTLRVKDIDLENQRFHLNTEAAGLKGAKGMRPLLLAQGSVADWMDIHPAPDDTEAYFITKLPDAARGDVHTPLYQSSISRPIREACQKAGIDRWETRGHAHNLRHSFVRWAYIQRDMDVQTIKWMGGWSQSSQTFEEVYFNILDVEHAAKAEQAAGTAKQESEDAKDLTPEVCPVCDTRLPATARYCPKCGLQLPGAEGIQERVKEEKKKAETLDQYKDSDLLQELLKRNPELANTAAESETE